MSLILASALSWGCAAPSLDVPVAGEASWVLELEPPIGAGRVGRSFRAWVRNAPVAGVPWLFAGELSATHERGLRRGEVPRALLERAVPLRYWRDAEDCGLQPLVWLDAETRYTLAWEGGGTLRSFETGSGAEPATTRVFPSADRAKHGALVVCDLPETVSIEPLTLEPGGVGLQVMPEMTGRPRPGCVTLVAEKGFETQLVSPPLILGRLLDAPAWQPEPEPEVESAPSLSCPGEWLASACLEVQDDRIFVTARDGDQLWLLEAPARAHALAVTGRRTLLLRELEPEATQVLRGSVLSAKGTLESVSLSVRTGARRRHLVLNEVLANPLGAESSSEWIELLNDGGRRATLADSWLVDEGGRVALPDVELEPGELALLVPSSFQSSGLDVPVPERVRLVKLPTLGTRGLSNNGEALLLVGSEGPLSRFPRLAAKKPGHSVARRAAAADDAADGFSEHGEPGASPGAPNSFGASSGAP